MSHISVMDWSRKVVAILCVLCLFPGWTLGESGYFWHITDIHYDPTYPDRKVSCRDGGTGEGEFGDYQCDSPLPLVNSAVREMAKQGPNPDFIIWNGDSTYHSFQGDVFSEEIILEQIRNMTSLILGEFPGIPVYPSFGNHDYYPKNALPVGRTSLYEEVADIWDVWLPQAAKESLANGGFYVADQDTVVSGKLRLLVVNSNIWSKFNPVVNTTNDPGDWFTWIRDQLEKARSEGFKVYLVSHVPLGTPLKPTWTRPDRDIVPADSTCTLHNKYNKAFLNVIKDYSDVIVMSFSGHDHSDFFNIIFDDKGDPISSFLIVPAVAPLYGAKERNPAVRLFRYDTSSIRVTDYTQYYLDLPESNEKGRAVWRDLYTFSEAYGYSEVSPSNMAGLLSDLERDAATFEKFDGYHRQAAGGTPCVDKCKSYYLCSLRYPDLDEWAACMNRELEPSGTTNISASVVCMVISFLAYRFIN